MSHMIIDLDNWNISDKIQENLTSGLRRNVIVTVLSKGQFAILKMAIIRPYFFEGSELLLSRHISTLYSIQMQGF